jgi:hypothetical protein
MDEFKEKLRSVRDRVAALGPRIRLRPDATNELRLRISSMATQIDAMLRLVATRAVKPVENLDETVEDTVAEARLLIHELERLLETAPKGLGAARAGGVERRQHERLETNVTVRLLRRAVHKNDADGGVSLSTETARRSALNVSSGGIFVALPAGELPELGVGNVVHVEVETPELKFSARATVARRDANGVGLSWILDEERGRRAVQTLLAAVRSGSARLPV